MNNENDIKRFYEGILTTMGAPTVVVPMLIKFTKIMDQDEYSVILFPEVRQQLADQLGIGLSRFFQVLQLMEDSSLVTQSTEIKQKYLLA